MPSILVDIELDAEIDEIRENTKVANVIDGLRKYGHPAVQAAIAQTDAKIAEERRLQENVVSAVQAAVEAGTVITIPLEKAVSTFELFVQTYNRVADLTHDNAVEKGFWPEGQELNVGEAIALMHEELSELLHVYRTEPDKPSDKIPDFLEVEEELADLIIRAMDFGAGRDLKVAEALVAKSIYNRSRPVKHGREF